MKNSEKVSIDIIANTNEELKSIKSSKFLETAYNTYKSRSTNLDQKSYHRISLHGKHCGYIRSLDSISNIISMEFAQIPIWQ